MPCLDTASSVIAIDHWPAAAMVSTRNKAQSKHPIDAETSLPLSADRVQHDELRVAEEDLPPGSPFDTLYLSLNAISCLRKPRSINDPPQSFTHPPPRYPYPPLRSPFDVIYSVLNAFSCLRKPRSINDLAQSFKHPPPRYPYPPLRSPFDVIYSVLNAFSCLRKPRSINDPP